MASKSSKGCCSPENWVSNIRIIIGVISSLCCAGLVFGFAGIYPRLLERRVFYEECGVGEILTNNGDINGDAPGPVNGLLTNLLPVKGGLLLEMQSSTLIGGTSEMSSSSDSSSEELVVEPPSCPAQRSSLSLMFTAATTLLNIIAFFCGMLLDYLGPRRTGMLGVIMVGSGCISFSLGHYYLGFLLMAQGGPPVYMATISFGNLYPKRAGTITSACVGAFDASSFIFVLLGFFMSLLSPSSTSSGDSSLSSLSTSSQDSSLSSLSSTSGDSSLSSSQNSFNSIFDNTFLLYGCFVIFFYGILISIFYPNEPIDDTDDIKKPIDYGSEISPTGEEISPTLLFGPDIHCKYADSMIHDSILSFDFLLFAYSISIYMVRLNFFIQSVALQMQEHFNVHDAAEKTEIFSIMLPAAGFLSIPLIGFLTDRCGTIYSWIVLWFMFFSFAMLEELSTKISNVDFLIILSFVCFCFCRPLVYTMIAIMTGRRFGFGPNFGKIYGSICSIAGACNSSVYWLNLATIDVFDGDYLPVNRFLTVLQFSTVLLPIYLYRDQWRSEKKEDQIVEFFSLETGEKNGESFSLETGETDDFSIKNTFIPKGMSMWNNILNSKSMGSNISPCSMSNPISISSPISSTTIPKTRGPNDASLNRIPSNNILNSNSLLNNTGLIGLSGLSNPTTIPSLFPPDGSSPNCSRGISQRTSENNVKKTPNVSPNKRYNSSGRISGRSIISGLKNDLTENLLSKDRSKDNNPELEELEIGVSRRSDSGKRHSIHDGSTPTTPAGFSRRGSLRMM